MVPQGYHADGISPWRELNGEAAAFHPFPPRPLSVHWTFTSALNFATVTAMRLLSTLLIVLGAALGALGCLAALGQHSLLAVPVGAWFGVGAAAISVGLLLRGRTITARD